MAYVTYTRYLDDPAHVHASAEAHMDYSKLGLGICPARNPRQCHSCWRNSYLHAFGEPVEKQRLIETLILVRNSIDMNIKREE